MSNNFIEAINDVREPATVDDSHGIQILNYHAFWQVLFTRSIKTIRTIHLRAFVQTLGKNKSGGRNGISRLQYFVNAFSQELSLRLANVSRLVFVGDDHFFLKRNGTGTDDPDFLFTSEAGIHKTLEAKIYFTEDSYYENVVTTNFHKADYCIAFIIKSKVTGYGQWYFSKKTDNYTKLCTITELAESDPWLTELVLPDTIYTIQFYAPGVKLGDLYDESVPEIVNYNIYHNKVKNISKVA